MEPRTVYDGFYHWSAWVVEVKNWRGQVRWQAQLTRHFGRRILGGYLSEDHNQARGPKRRTQNEAVADANRLLDLKTPETQKGIHVA